MSSPCCTISISPPNTATGSSSCRPAGSSPPDRPAKLLTYEHLTAAYETEIYVDLNDITGTLVVTPLSTRARRRLQAAQPADERPETP